VATIDGRFRESTTRREQRSDGGGAELVVEHACEKKQARGDARPTRCEGGKRTHEPDRCEQVRRDVPPRDENRSRVHRGRRPRRAPRRESVARRVARTRRTPPRRAYTRAVPRRRGLFSSTRRTTSRNACHTQNTGRKSGWCYVGQETARVVADRVLELGPHTYRRPSRAPGGTRGDRSARGRPSRPNTPKGSNRGARGARLLRRRATGASAAWEGVCHDRRADCAWSVRPPLDRDRRGFTMASTTTGFLLIADITGYTQYLSESELEHAQGVPQHAARGVARRDQGTPRPLAARRRRGDLLRARRRVPQRADLPRARREHLRRVPPGHRQDGAEQHVQVQRVRERRRPRPQVLRPPWDLRAAEALGARGARRQRREPALPTPQESGHGGHRACAPTRSIPTPQSRSSVSKA
jgi:hypothetical protein